MRPKLLLAGMGFGGMLASLDACAQRLDSLAGPRSAEALEKSIDAEQYNLRYGPVRLKTSVGVGVSYTDNVYYSRTRQADLLINPEVTLGALWPLTELNAFRLSLGLGYEWYLENHELNGDAPLVNPGSELVFNLFAGDFRIQLHERFSYQESLFFNGFSGEDGRFYNLNDVGTFARLDNQAGFQVDWDLNKLILSTSYNHENFISTTSDFEYLNRASEWFSATAGFFLGDAAQTGLEAQASLHNYEREAVLNDHWRARVGPFAEVKLQEKISLRAGGGFDTARYDSAAVDGDYDTCYAYARIRHETRLFSHSVSAGREHLLGNNANNLKTTFVRYSVSSPIVAHLELEARLSINFAKEFGGGFSEEFTYYGAGFRAGSQFHKYWRMDLSYEYRRKESDLLSRDFRRNRVTLSTTYNF